MWHVKFYIYIYILHILSCCAWVTWKTFEGLFYREAKAGWLPWPDARATQLEMVYCTDRWFPRLVASRRVASCLVSSRLVALDAARKSRVSLPLLQVRGNLKSIRSAHQNSSLSLSLFKYSFSLCFVLYETLQSEPFTERHIISAKYVRLQISMHHTDIRVEIQPRKPFRNPYSANIVNRPQVGILYASSNS